MRDTVGFVFLNCVDWFNEGYCGICMIGVVRYNEGYCGICVYDWCSKLQ